MVRWNLRLLSNYYKRSRGRLFSREGWKMAALQVSEMSSLSKVNPVIGVVQLTCTADKEKNLQACTDLINKAKTMGAQMVFLPEAADYIGESKVKSMEMSESLDGPIVTQYCSIAKETGMWLSVCYHQKGPNENSNRILNTHIIIDSAGKIQSSYCKTHLFDLDIEGKIRLCESDYTLPGNRIVSPVSTPVGKVGLGICYDLRFPEMSIALTQQGAEILTYPSAFTVTTGLAHWEVLLRSRAIENQCYVVAAAQTGKHNEKRSSYGHSVVIDPWGTVVAQCREGVDVCLAEIDLSYLHKVRRDMPVWQHRRHDLYGTIQVSNSGNIDSQEEYQFGQHPIKSQFVFYKSALSYCFVNIKPVKPGHVLVASLRCVEKLTDLSPAETSDLFLTVQKVSKVVQQHFGGSSLTVSVQDGPDAGQTVKHVHVHIMPRRPGDFAQNDDVYKELETHDKDLSQIRSEAVMKEEASQLRKYFS